MLFLLSQQETWAPKDNLTIEDIQADVQKNFENIADRAMQLGINHFETARGYGSSELQFGPIVKKYPRDSFILQTKVPPKASSQEFRELLETSFSKLQLDGEGEENFVDLFSFHGINKDEVRIWIYLEHGYVCVSVFTTSCYHHIESFITNTTLMDIFIYDL